MGQSQQQASPQQPQQVQQPQQQMAGHLVTQVGAMSLEKIKGVLGDMKNDLEKRREECS